MCRNYRMAQKPKPSALVRRYVVCAIGVTKLLGPDGIAELQEAQISLIAEGALKRRRHRKLENLGSNYRSRNAFGVRNFPAHFLNSLPDLSHETPMCFRCGQPSGMNSGHESSLNEILLALLSTPLCNSMNILKPRELNGYQQTHFVTLLAAQPRRRRDKRHP